MAVQNPLAINCDPWGICKIAPHPRLDVSVGWVTIPKGFTITIFVDGGPKWAKMLSQLGSEPTIRPSTTRRALTSSRCKGCGETSGRLKSPMPSSELGYKTMLRSWLAHHITTAGSGPVKSRRFACSLGLGWVGQSPSHKLCQGGDQSVVWLGSGSKPSWSVWWSLGAPLACAELALTTTGL